MQNVQRLLMRPAGSRAGCHHDVFNDLPWYGFIRKKAKGAAAIHVPIKITAAVERFGLGKFDGGKRDVRVFHHAGFFGQM